jgi:hypothetical protein
MSHQLQGEHPTQEPAACPVKATGESTNRPTVQSRDVPRPQGFPSDQPRTRRPSANNSELENSMETSPAALLHGSTGVPARGVGQVPVRRHP